MRDVAAKSFAENAASAKDAGKLSAIAHKSIEDGRVVASVLKTNLEAEGYTLTVKPGTKHGFWITVSKDDLVVAQGFADTETEALAQAIAAEVRTEATATEPAQ